MKTRHSVRIVALLFALVLCGLFAVSVADTAETVRKTNFSLENMQTHIQKLSENGPRPAETVSAVL